MLYPLFLAVDLGNVEPTCSLPLASAAMFLPVGDVATRTEYL